MRSDQFSDVFLTTRNMEKTGLNVSVENTSQKMFTGNDKISEIVNDSDSNGGNFSELSDNMCKVNSLFSSSNSSSRSKEQEVFQPEPGRGQEENMQCPSVGLLESDYSYPITPYAISVQMSWDRFLTLLMMF
jgi:hypothetical protein